MKRNYFRTKNQLKVHTYVYIVIMLVVLLVFFLLIGNFYRIASMFNWDHHVESEKETAELLERDMDRVAAQFEELTKERANSASVLVGLYGEGPFYDMTSNQLELMRLPWVALNDLPEKGLDRNLGLIVVAKDDLSTEDVHFLTAQCERGASIWFPQFPGEAAKEQILARQLMGIKRMGKMTTWPRMRSSYDLLTGILVEVADEEVTAYDIQLVQQTKVFCSALPRGHEDIDNEDLPPLIWRYVKGGGSGAVYVCNGDFMGGEICYGIMPLILRELQESVVYPVVNAYCILVDGAPYAGNGEREAWWRLYSRDMQGMQQDMFMPMCRRLSSIYGGVLTYFSPDYEAFYKTEDALKSYYMREIRSNQGALAIKDGDELHIQRNDDPVDIVPWKMGFQFWWPDEKKFQLPINYTVNSEDTPEIFHVAGMIGGTGYYCVRIAVEDILEYDGQQDIWMDYCKNLESVVGTLVRDFSYLDMVTAGEALNRVYQLMNMQFRAEYFDDSIELSAENEEGTSWYILCTRHEGLRIDNGTIEETGNECYLVTMKGPHATITWER